MIIARYEHEGRIFHGSVRDERIFELSGSIFDQPVETQRSLPLDRVRLLYPVEPSKIVCVGQNYRGHIAELGVPTPKEPVVFLKPPSCLIGPGQSIAWPSGMERVDYEGELAVVIGQTISRADPEKAVGGILGCSCFNDVTERAMVGRDPFLLSLAKGFDTFGCFGPWLVTGLDPDKLEITTRLNNEVMQSDNTKNCVFSAGDVLSYISRYITLVPGDVVITGTPKGVAPMKPGDTVEVEIEGIGPLSNPVAGDSAQEGV